MRFSLEMLLNETRGDSVKCLHVTQARGPQKTTKRAGKMAQSATALAFKSNNLSSVSRTPMVKGQTQFPWDFL